MSRRVVLVTGAAGGIGRVIVSRLLRDGHSVVGVDKLPFDPGEQIYYQADLTSVGACRAVVESAIDALGPIDVLINNAAVGPSHIRPDAERNHPTMDELTLAQWDEAFEVNARAPFLLTKAVLPAMKAQRWGRIVNVTTSYRTMLRLLPYGATKSALEAMSAIWAAELAGTGVTCNVLVPGGPTDTAFIAPESGWPREKMLRPDVMAEPAAWLCSEASNNITGRRFDASKWNQTERRERAIAWPELCYSAREWQLDAPTLESEVA